MPCDPAPAISPIARGTSPTTRRIREAVVPPDRMAMVTIAIPASVAIHPTTNSPGADRPSIVNVELPARAGADGVPTSSGRGPAGGAGGVNAPGEGPAGASAAGRAAGGRGPSRGRAAGGGGVG